jgi:hypothetical protein
MTVDTSFFTWIDESVDPLTKQVARVNFGSDKVKKVGSAPQFIVPNKTEIVFTRAWTQSRAIVSSADYIPAGVAHAGDVRVRLGAMDNPKVNGVYQYPFERALAEVNPQTSVGNNVYGEWETWNQGWMENSLNFLDQPGEWFFDDDNIVLYYCPTTSEVVDTKVFQLPVTYSLVKLEGASDDQPVRGVRFIGEGTPGTVGVPGTTTGQYHLQFRNTAWKYENGRGNNLYHNFQNAAYGMSGLIDGTHVDGFVTQLCRFSDFGTFAVALGGNRRWILGRHDNEYYGNQPRGIVKNVVIDSNRIENGGGGGVKLDHYPKLTYPNRNASASMDNNMVSKNMITQVGRCFADAPGIKIMHAINTSVVGNHLSNLPHVGIHSGATKKRTLSEQVVISGNVISDTMNVLVDGGAIYTQSGLKTQILDNGISSTNSASSRNSNGDAIPATYSATANKEIYLDRNSEQFFVRGNTYSGGSLRMLIHQGSQHNLLQQSDKSVQTSELPVDFGWDLNESLISCGCGVRLEVETLGAGTVIADTGSSGGQYVSAGTTANGQSITFNVPVGTDMAFKKHAWRVGARESSANGIAQGKFVVNGVQSQIGDPIDLYSSTVTYSDVLVGNVVFTNTGTYGFRFAVTGKNANSYGRNITVDYITLIENVD